MRESLRHRQVMVGCHEAGAIEYTGHKVLTLPEKNGKISAESITDYVETFLWGCEP